MTLQRDPSVISGTNHLIMKSRLIHSYPEIWSYSNMFSLVLHSGEIQTNSESSLVHLLSKYLWSIYVLNTVQDVGRRTSCMNKRRHGSWLPKAWNLENF